MVKESVAKVNEFDKFKSKDWRLNNLYKIIDKDAKLVRFREFPIQREVRLAKGRIKQVLKARQMGITAGATIDLLDDTIWTPNKTTMVLAHKRGDLDKIFQKVRIAYKEMHPSIKPVIDRGGGSKYEMRFPEINSKIFIDIENRGDTIHRLHVSEYAFVDPERLRATLGAVVPTAQICYESTPNGMSGDFYQHWVNPHSTRTKLFFPWFFQPEYQVDGSHIKKYTADEKDLIRDAKNNYGIAIGKHQIAWRRVQIQENGEMFFQEFPENDIQCFLASGQCPIDQEFVSKLLKELPEPILDDGTLKIWKTYDKTKRYVLGIDVAEGVKLDHSVIDVFCTQTKEQVAQFRSNTIKPFKLADKIVEIAGMFTSGGRPWPLVGVERNNHGHAVLEYLYHTKTYSNLFQHKEDTNGWHTNLVTRPIMVNTFIDGFENETIKINSPETLGECLTLVNNKGKIEADTGHHDDCFMSGCIGVQMLMSDSTNDFYENISQKILV